ncbi:hemerythrin domain-containing protein [Actinoplanes sp. LDG1-06]|uniref:Hemerythrin domain-containing protein n=1 Tax=Paractinoplanes ovalisporus TaxID=2810368 RepID=A0ABS2A2P3_9ACTN|nr:hemerythrin domain-containing protein [Actinoplanes ovalisporus]MBM2614113.1 hemerythrin domain-containing protein [Actinoplanes ovalisporus]
MTMTQQLMLPGQAAAPDGPNDLTGMFLIHHAFRRDLRAFAAAVANTPAHETNTWRALDERWKLFGTFLHHHHTIEDASIWPVLLDRVDAAGRATLEAMEAEHGEIDPLLEACGAGFAKLAAGPDEDVRRSLEIRVVAAAERLSRHLAHEETEALVLVQQHLTTAEWEVVEKKSAKGEYTFRESMTAVPWVMHELPADAQKRLLTLAGPVLAVLWRLTRGGFLRREKTAFPYA